MAKKEKITKVENKRNRLLTYNQTAFLWLLCGVCWVISAILNIVAKENPIFDFIVGIVFIVIGVLYLVKGKKENNK